MQLNWLYWNGYAAAVHFAAVAVATTHCADACVCSFWSIFAIVVISFVVAVAKIQTKIRIDGYLILVTVTVVNRCHNIIRIICFILFLILYVATNKIPYNVSDWCVQQKMELIKENTKKWKNDTRSNAYRNI